MTVIGIINNENDGPGYHRVMMPLLEMDGVDVYIRNLLTEEIIEQLKPDALYLNRGLARNPIEQVLGWRDKYGFSIIVDIDDYWHLHESHPMRKAWMQNGIPAKIERWLSVADVVTTTHERLAEKITPINERVEVLPNAIPKVGQFAVHPREGDRVRIFWQGSPTHTEDIKLLDYALKRLYRKPQTKDRCVQVFAGYHESEEWQRISDVYTGREAYPYVAFPGVSPDKYYASYAFADICVVPLIATEFNGHKSPLKILEAANMGLPVVVSQVNPYLGFDGAVLYANNDQEWYLHLRALVNDEGMRREYGDRLLQFCDKNYNFETINKKRYDTIQQTISRR